MTETEKIYNDIAAQLGRIGLELVDIVLSRHKGSTQVRAVVYGAGGTGIEECSKAHKLMAPRLEELLEDGDFSLETASPGIDRVFRNPREYRIFAGRGVRLTLSDESEAEAGRIVSSDGVNVILSTGGAERSIPIERVVKARLDASQEGR